LAATNSSASRITRLFKPAASNVITDCGTSSRGKTNLSLQNRRGVINTSSLSKSTWKNSSGRASAMPRLPGGRFLLDDPSDRHETEDFCRVAEGL
jgi:hypothetical protein